MDLSEKSELACSWHRLRCQRGREASNTTYANSCRRAAFKKQTGCNNMVDSQRIEGTKLYQEMGREKREYWFDMKTKKFLHNVDTFYYSVKLNEDFTHSSQDKNVLAFRHAVERMQRSLTVKHYSGEVMQFYVTGIDDYLNLLPLRFAHFYTFCLERPEMFDVFMAPVVPGNDSGSVTSEIVVQIRSAMLWELGVYAAFEETLRWVTAICEMFGFTIAEVKENRTDFCWHTNYLEQPEKFFALDNFYRMRVDRYKDAVYHTEKRGSEDYEVDYVSLGRRGGRCFIRIYNKTKEVIEKNYKPFFLKTWLFHGLINRYDLFLLEEAYIRKSWAYITVARLKFYQEHGEDENRKNECQEQIEVFETGSKVTDIMLQLADELTPPLNLIYNIEFQLMRKASKSYSLIPFKANDKYGPAKRIYDFLDNRKLICEYLTTDIFRLVEKTGDSNKWRRPDCAFWIALKRTKMIDCAAIPENLKIHREYSRKLNAEKLRKSILNQAVTYGMYIKGKNQDSPVSDAMLALCRMNDNDIHNAKLYKEKKSKLLSDTLLQEALPDNGQEFDHLFTMYDDVTGEIFMPPDIWEDES